MRYWNTVGGGDPWIRTIPVKHSTTDVVKGALVIRGTTDDSTEPFAVVGASAAADVLGVLEELVDNADTDSNIDGTAYIRAKVSMNPFNTYLVEYDQSDTAAETSASSSTTFNCTSVEGIAGGWIYMISGAAIGQLQWITADDTNSLTTKTALTTTGGSDTFIKILPQFHLLAKLITNATAFGSDAGAGSVPVLILENYIEADNVPFQKLDATKHSGLTGLNSQNVKFYAEVLFRDHALNPLS